MFIHNTKPHYNGNNIDNDGMALEGGALPPPPLSDMGQGRKISGHAHFYRPHPPILSRHAGVHY